MQQFQIISRYPEDGGSTILDINEDFTISLNYQIEDILDISKRNTSFSKTFVLPGTNVNNVFFKQIFDVNIDSGVGFDPSRRAPVTIRVDDNEIFKGDLQLLNVILDHNLVEYEVIVMGKLKDILTEFDFLSIKDLDYSQYDHIRDTQTVINSWDYIVKVNGTDINYGEGGNGYVYPDIAYNDYTANYSNTPLAYFYPATYVKTIMDAAFRKVGYTYTSNFLNSEYYKKLILPYSLGKIQITDEEKNERSILVGPDGINNPEFPGGGLPTGFISLTSGALFANSVYQNVDFASYLPFTKESGTVNAQSGELEFRDDLGQWAEYSQLGQFTAAKTGYYDIDLDCKLYPKYYQNSGFGVKWQDPATFLGQYRYIVQKYNNTLGELSAQGFLVPDPYTDIFDSGDLQFIPGNNVINNFVSTPYRDFETSLLMNYNTTNLFLNEGDRIRILVELQCYGAANSSSGWNTTGGAGQSVGLRYVAQAGWNDNWSYLKITPSSNESMGNDEIKLNETLTNIKVKDFFLDQIKMFNLVVQDDPNTPNNVIIEPRDDYFASKQKILNWEEERKLDYDSDVEITPMSELDANAYAYTYTEDNDFFNVQYTDETTEVYGELEVSVTNDFSFETNTTKLLFSPTPSYRKPYGLSILGGNNFVRPYFVDFQDETWKERVIKPRILFYGGLLPFQIDYETGNAIGNNFKRILEYIPSGDGNDSSNLGPSTQGNLPGYPYVGMWDHPTFPTYDLGFGRTKKIYWETNQYPVQNLFQKFHKATLNNIIDPNSRLLTGMFHLTPRDIAEFDFRDIVFLLGSYWRVNKIENYNPLGADSLTKVILYKINDIKTFEPNVIQVPTSNDSCPTDIVAKRKKNLVFYVSVSGQFISQDCCKQIGGVFVQGKCRARNVFDPIPNDGPKWVKGGLGVSPTSDKNGPEILKSGNNIRKSPVKIAGYNNNVSEQVGPNLIVGSSNSILSGATNNVIIGDGISVNQSNNLYVGNVRITPDGFIIPTKYKIIDGGVNEVMRVDKVNLIDIVDGTVDAVRNYGGASKLRPIIDGNITFTPPI
jgi:hypothetical protein